MLRDAPTLSKYTTQEVLQITKLREPIQRAFLQKEQGDSRGYNHIIKILKQRPTEGENNYLIYLFALKQCVSLIKPSYNMLLDSLLSFDWAISNERLVDAMIDLLLDLISSDISHTVPCFRMLVGFLLPKSAVKDEGSVDSFQLESEKQRTIHVHRCIKLILNLVPGSPALLFPVLEQRFPHKSHPLGANIVYLYNLLQIANHSAVLRDQILTLATDKILQIDVEIKLDDVIEDLIDDGEENVGIFDLELDELGETHQKAIEMATKLDRLMELMFEYLEHHKSADGEDKRDYIFRLLLSIFDYTILNTHQSKYTQFLIFYTCHLEERFQEEFLGYLLNKMLDQKSHTLTRQTCTAYIGSFIARSRLIPTRLIRETLILLVSWCFEYLKQTTYQATPDAELHALFYSICQTIFYIFCFKYQRLVEDEDGKTTLRQLRLETLIDCKLNPFKFCLWEILEEFIRQSARYGLQELANHGRNKIEENKRIVLPTRTVFGGVNKIQSYFPFDPYILRHSSRFLQNLYQHWREDETPWESDEVARTPPSGGSYNSLAKRDASDSEASISESTSVEQDVSFRFSWDQQ